MFVTVNFIYLMKIERIYGNEKKTKITITIRQKHYSHKTIRSWAEVHKNKTIK